MVGGFDDANFTIDAMNNLRLPNFLQDPLPLKLVFELFSDEDTSISVIYLITLGILTPIAPLA